MLLRILADAAVVLHLAFILFAVLGGLLVIRRPCLVWAHLPAVVWAGAVACKGWICPLTYLENHYRIKAGEAGYTGGFIEHYLIPVIYPDALTRDLQMLLGTAVILLNSGIYLFAVLKWRKAKAK